MSKVYICGPRDCPRGDNKIGKTIVNTTSRMGWSSGLSPFLIGSCNLFEGYTSKNMENAWQFSKVYAKVGGIEMVDAGGNPNRNYWKWAKSGWNDNYAHRYPAGKGTIPLYSLWEGEKLGYIEARARIYIPLYAAAVKTTNAFAKLKEMYETEEELWLWDFDGYNHRALNMNWDQVKNNPSKKMGHAFVLGMLLEGRLS